MKPQKSVIIVAGGTGKRMQTRIPKQFLLLKGKPLLFHTIEKFYKVDNKIRIILVLPQNQILFWQNLIKQYDFSIKLQITTGGKERYHSVKNGLKLVDTELVAVHDGVRPLVSVELIKKGFALLQKYQSAIPVIKPFSSVRILEKEKNFAIDREKIRLVQTPQFFRTDLLKTAYEKTDFRQNITDDATVFEKAGFTVFLFEGEEKNIKITKPLDLKIAELLTE